MKYCGYCGKEYPDDAEICPLDHQELKRVGEIQPPPVDDGSRDRISPEERRFWARMTFRQFAILYIRLQALWLFFGAGVEATYLPGYYTTATTHSSYSAAPTAAAGVFLMLFLRILIRIAVAVLLIQKAEKVLSWLVKDYVNSPSTDSADVKEGYKN